MLAFRSDWSAPKRCLRCFCLQGSLHMTDLTTWLEEYSAFDIPWYVKRLSGNDTLANGTHQAGPYIPKGFLFEVFPELDRDKLNPDVWFRVSIDSHSDERDVRAVWYNNKFHGGTRNETRLTNFGGGSSALLDPENTGAIAVFAFVRTSGRPAYRCHAWVCRNEVEEDSVECCVGPVDPGQGLRLVESATGSLPEPIQRGSCWLERSEIPPNWLEEFPSGDTIVRKAVELQPARSLSPDTRLMKRRECEFDIFRSLEEAKELPEIMQHKTFTDINQFLKLAQSILQRRKTRSGRSLELHARIIFTESGLSEGQDFTYQPHTEPGRRPDFVFPSEEAYQDPSFPQSSLRMLAVKTTCKDRWRQILNEAARIERKHLLTLQEGMSERQFNEMVESRVQLVVPDPLHKKLSAKIRSQVMTLERFIDEAKHLEPK